MSRKSDPPRGKQSADPVLLQTEELESATMCEGAWRLVPFLCLIYVVAFIDRINIGFAALTMSKDLGLTPAMFGFELLVSETLAWSGDGRLNGGHSGRQFHRWTAFGSSFANERHRWF
jgi:hypothetical protein